MTLETIADVVPNGVATPLGTAGQKATWIGLVASGSSLRIGDSNVGAGRGMVLPTGVPVYLHRGAFNQQPYPLDRVFVYGASSGCPATTDRVSVIFGV